MPTETEIKLRLRDSSVLQRIEAMGYKVRTPRELETDQLYDRESELRSTGQALRLRRRGSRCTLTYKGPAQRTPHKTREEIECDISDGAAFELVLTKLGYQPSFRYEKYRTTYADPAQPGIITIDETPLGEFLELEGLGEWIDSTALMLGYLRDEYITESYASLWRKHCESNPQAVPSAMTF